MEPKKVDEILICVMSISIFVLLVAAAVGLNPRGLISEKIAGKILISLGAIYLGCFICLYLKIFWDEIVLRVKKILRK